MRRLLFKTAATLLHADGHFHGKEAMLYRELCEGDWQCLPQYVISAAPSAFKVDWPHPI